MVAVLESDCRFRAMTVDDIDNVLEVENNSYDFPWSRQIFMDCLQVGYSCYVLEINQQLVGYAIITIAANESHLLNICIAPDFRGHGYARLLMHYLLDEAKAHGSKDIFLEVRPSNDMALKLYYSLGFMQIGIRQNYYMAMDGREDALVMMLQLVNNG